MLTQTVNCMSDNNI